MTATVEQITAFISRELAEIQKAIEMGHLSVELSAEQNALARVLRFIMRRGAL